MNGSAPRRETGGGRFCFEAHHLVPAPIADRVDVLPVQTLAQARRERVSARPLVLPAVPLTAPRAAQARLPEHLARLVEQLLERAKERGKRV